MEWAARTAATLMPGAILISLVRAVMAPRIDRPLVAEEWEGRLPMAGGCLGGEAGGEAGGLLGERTAAGSESSREEQCGLRGTWVAMAKAPRGQRDRGTVRRRADGPAERNVRPREEARQQKSSEAMSGRNGGRGRDAETGQSHWAAGRQCDTRRVLQDNRRKRSV